MQAGTAGGGFADPFRHLELTPATAAGFFGRPFATKEEAQEEVRSRILEELRGHCGNPVATAFGLKLTSITHEIDLLAELFADVRVVFTVRDPRDIRRLLRA